MLIEVEKHHFLSAPEQKKIIKKLRRKGYGKNLEALS